MAKFDAMASVYDASRGGLERGRHFAGEIAKWLPDGPGPILELGIGTGAVAMGLAGRGYEVVGSDISARMLAMAAERVPGRLCLADAGVLPHRAGAFGAAYAAWTMNHFDNPDAVLAETARVLRPDGRFLAMDRNLVDAGEDPLVILTAELDRRLGRERPILRPRSEWFAELAEKRGFVRIGVIPTVPWREARTLRHALWNLRQRAFGWDGTEDEWTGVVEPVIDEFSRRDDLDEVRWFDQGHELLVLERQGGPD